MAEPQPDVTPYRWRTIALLVGAAVFASYGINQYGRLNDLYQRELSKTATELQRSVETAVETLTQFDRKWNDSPSVPKVCDFDQSQPYLDQAECQRDAGPRWGFGAVVQAVATPTLGVEATDLRDNRETTGSKPRSVSFAFRIDTLFQELAFPDAFTVIFVARDDGVVLYQEAPVQRSWLRHLRWGEQVFRDASADSPKIQIRNVQRLFGEGQNWNVLTSVSSRTTVQLGGSPQQLYLHPVTINRANPVNVIVGGGCSSSGDLLERNRARHSGPPNSDCVATPRHTWIPVHQGGDARAG